MIHLGLIGHPLGHSLSPKIHRAALQVCGLEGDYCLFPILPDDRLGLQKLLDQVRAGEILGLNVTIPHKQNVIEFMDQLTPTAKATGAVNTIYFRDNHLIGDNTDAPGFLTDLKRLLPLATEGTERRNALILGAGGSARAIVYALVNDAWNVSLVARRMEQAQALANSFASNQISVADHIANIELSNISLIVNSTSVGMTPNVEGTPWPENLPFPKAMVYDLIYNPGETRLMKDARAQGLAAAGGLGMLVEQAALAFETWTGHVPPRNILYASVIK